MAEISPSVNSQDEYFIKIAPIRLPQDYDSYVQCRGAAFDPVQESLETLWALTDLRPHAILKADYGTEQAPNVGDVSMVGTTTLINNPWAMVARLAVRENFRHRKIATALTLDALRLLKLERCQNVELLVDADKESDLRSTLAQGFYARLGFEPVFNAVGMKIEFSDARDRVPTLWFPGIPPEDTAEVTTKLNAEEHQDLAYRHIFKTLSDDPVSDYRDASPYMDPTELNACLKTSSDSRLRNMTVKTRHMPGDQVITFVSRPYAGIIKTREDGTIAQAMKHWAVVMMDRHDPPPIQLLHKVIYEEDHNGVRRTEVGGDYVARDIRTNELIPFRLGYNSHAGQRMLEFKRLDRDQAGEILNELILGAQAVGEPRPDPYLGDVSIYTVKGGELVDL